MWCCMVNFWQWAFLMTLQPQGVISKIKRNRRPYKPKNRPKEIRSYHRTHHRKTKENIQTNWWLSSRRPTNDIFLSPKTPRLTGILKHFKAGLKKSFEKHLKKSTLKDRHWTPQNANALFDTLASPPIYATSYLLLAFCFTRVTSFGQTPVHFSFSFYFIFSFSHPPPIAIVIHDICFLKQAFFCHNDFLMVFNQLFIYCNKKKAQVPVVDMNTKCRALFGHPK